MLPRNGRNEASFPRYDLLRSRCISGYDDALRVAYARRWVRGYRVWQALVLSLPRAGNFKRWKHLTAVAPRGY